MANINLRKFNPASMTDPVFLDKPAGWYFGEVVDGKRHGQGMFFWPGGEAYMGSWANDMRNGFGVFRDSSGGMTIGTWLNRRLVGWGVDFEWMSPSGIKFELPDDEDFLAGVGEEFIRDHKDWIMDKDGEFSTVHEGSFRGQKPSGYGTRYFRNRETGVVHQWTTGEHNSKGELDGFGTDHDGNHPRFSIDETELEEVYSVQGMYELGELVPGAGRVINSYWLGTNCVQVVEANGYINEHGYIEGPVNVVLDGTTLWSGVVKPDMDVSVNRQIKDFLLYTNDTSEAAYEMIEAQRERTVERILEDGEDAASLDSSSVVPGFADMTPEASWVVDVMVAQSASVQEIKRLQRAEQERYNEGSLEYTKRCFIHDEDGDPVDRMDAVRIYDGKLTLDFEIPFTPTITTSPTTNDEGEPRTLAYVMFGNKIVGMFKYDNTKLTVKTDEMTFESDEMYYGEGTRVFIPVTDGGEDFEYNLEVETNWADSDEYPNDHITRDMQTWLDKEEDNDDDNDDPEGMDVERDEDGNITGMGFSMTGANPDQETQNLNTLLNVFKNGGHFAPIDEIMEDAKKSK